MSSLVGLGIYKNKNSLDSLDKPEQMLWSQFSYKILGTHFGNSVLNNNNWDKINDNLTK